MVMQYDENCKLSRILKGYNLLVLNPNMSKLIRTEENNIFLHIGSFDIVGKNLPTVLLSGYSNLAKQSL
jgi:hypothetical protein